MASNARDVSETTFGPQLHKFRHVDTLASKLEAQVTRLYQTPGMGWTNVTESEKLERAKGRTKVDYSRR